MMNFWITYGLIGIGYAAHDSVNLAQFLVIVAVWPIDVGYNLAGISQLLQGVAK